MKVSLKKFTKNPYPLIKKAPIIITINNEAKYALIPYVVYKTTFENKPTSHVIHQNTVANHIEQGSKKRHWILRLLFD